MTWMRGRKSEWGDLLLPPPGPAGAGWPLCQGAGDSDGHRGAGAVLLLLPREDKVHGRWAEGPCQAGKDGAYHTGVALERPKLHGRMTTCPQAGPQLRPEGLNYTNLKFITSTPGQRARTPHYWVHAAAATQPGPDPQWWGSEMAPATPDPLLAPPPLLLNPRATAGEDGGGPSSFHQLEVRGSEGGPQDKEPPLTPEAN